MPVEIKRLLFTFAHCAFHAYHISAIRPLDDEVLKSDYLLGVWSLRLKLAVYERRLFR